MWVWVFVALYAAFMGGCAFVIAWTLMRAAQRCDCGLSSCAWCSRSRRYRPGV